MNRPNLIILHWVKFFNKGLDEDGQKEGLFKRLKNIENITEKQLNAIENQRTRESDKKDSKTANIKNSLIYDQNHNFYKYSLDKFSNIS